MKRQRTLLLSTSALTFVTALGVSAPTVAFACTAASVNTTISTSTSCVTWTGGSLSIANSGTINASGVSAIAAPSGTPGNLTNSGTLTSDVIAVGISIAMGSINNVSTIVGSSGIANAGTISTIINSGLIHGTGVYGIENSGSLGAILNSGTIQSAPATAGIGNNSGTINLISISGHSSGIANWFGYIGTVSNSGTITQSGDGIFNYGTIDTVSVSGFISVNSAAVYNGGSIGLISISGTLNGGSVAINNQGGVINTIVNSGTISGISNSGTISAITNTNSGLINGPAGISNSGLIGGGVTAISSSGTLSGISNSGTILGNILVNQILTISGGTGTLAGGTINTNNHDLVFAGGASQVLADTLNVGAAHTVTNNGVLQVNTAQSIIGNYAQATSAALVIGVGTLANHGSLTISGGAVMTGGLLSISYLDGPLSSNETLTILQASTIGTDYTGISVAPIGYDSMATLSSIISGGYDDLVISISSTCEVVNSNMTVSSSIGCVSWNGSNLSIVGSGVIGGKTTGIIADGALGTLTNSGSISGATFGVSVNSLGTIAAFVNEGGASLSGSSAAIHNAGSIGVITNNGNISAIADYAIYNSGTVGTIGNAGSIGGPSAGIENAGSIVLISNNAGATISSSNSGIVNTGTLASIVNNGVILSTGFAGVNNNGTIGTIINNVGASIGGHQSGGIFNSSGTIGLISNSGTIGGGNAGVFNYASIASINNVGTISGASGIKSLGEIGVITNSGLINATCGDCNGIWNDYGSIGTINNSGTVQNVANSGGTTAAITNNNTLGSLINSGLIKGHSALYSNGTILSAINNSGTIAGSINAFQSLTITGGTALAPGVLTGYNGSITTITTNNNNLVFDSGAHQLLGENVNVGASNAVVVDGSLQVNTIASIAGNYTQATTGKLIIGAASSSSYGELVISGGATLSNDHINITALSGSLTAGESFTIMQASAAGSDYSGVVASAGAGFVANVSSLSSGGFEDLIISISASSCSVVNSSATVNSGIACVVWNGANLSVGSAGVVSGSATGIGNVGNNVGTLTNNGSITGSIYALRSTGSIAALINNSTISGSTGILNDVGGSIGALSNAGVIGGSVDVGIYNNGFIGSLNNSGTVSGGISGITNDGSILALSNLNGGTISGGIINLSSINTITNSAGATIIGNGQASAAGIGNAFSIGTISNSGLVAGGDYGILNSGTIDAIINSASGTIGGSITGISNQGIISFLSNNGSINGGIVNSISGVIASISNSGTISGGATAINNNGTIEVINNSGVISGDDNIGINNNGTMDSIGNTSVVSGYYTGINNNNTIGTISNSGTISGNGNHAINNDGIIGLIENVSGGTISGIGGIINVGTIGAINNSGLINGSAGITSSNNGAMIGTLSNSGTISGTNFGYVNGSGTIDLIENASGGTINGGNTAIYNGNGTIGTILNSGLISGPNAIYSGSNGTILSALSNAGTIAGNINVDQALTITGGSAGDLGALTGFGGSIGTITTNSHDVTFDANAFQLMDDDINVGTSNTVFNNGLIRVNATHSITGNYNQGAGGTLVVGVTDASHYGQLIVSGAANMTNGQVLIAPTTGSLSAGETFTIVQAATVGTSYAGINATASGYAVTTSSIVSGGFEDLIVALSTGAPEVGGSGNASYMQIASQTAGPNGANVGTVLDQIQSNVANGGSSSFVPILTALNNIGQSQGVAAEGAAIKQLAPGQLGSGVTASNMTANQSMAVVGQHQQAFHNTASSPVGESAGSEYHVGALWMQVSGGFANSTNAGAGYDQNFYAMTFGADRNLGKNATVGMAISWAHSNASGSNELSGDNIATSTPEIMGYGTYRMGRAYIDGTAGIGYNMFTQSRNIGFLNSVATSKYSGMQYMGSAETGYNFSVTPRTTMTPLFGIQAVRADTDSYNESGAGAADTSVGRQIVDSYSTTLGGRFTTAIPTAWGSLLPEVKLSWVHDLNSGPISSNATLAGVNFVTTTPRISPDGAEVTLGATLEKSDSLSLRAEYSGDLRSNYQSHTGEIKGEFSF